MTKHLFYCCLSDAHTQEYWLQLGDLTGYKQVVVHLYLSS